MDVDMIARLIINEGEKRFVLIPEFLGAFRLYLGQKTKKTIDDDRIFYQYSAVRCELIYVDKHYQP